MKLNLVNISKNERGFYVESYKTDNPKIASVNFQYQGTEDDLDVFLKSTIIDYVKQHKMIVE